MMFCYAVAPCEPDVSVRRSFDDALSPTAKGLRETFDLIVASHHSVIAAREEEVDRLLSSALLEGAEVDRVFASRDAVARTAAVLRSLPAGIPMPSIVVESDSEIGLDWDEGSRRVLSVSVGDGPMLKYAALIGAEPLHGRVPFAGTLPETLSFVLSRIYPQTRHEFRAYLPIRPR